MLKEYKRKFILSNMLLAGTVLFLMLAATFLYLYHTDVSDLEATMAHLTEPFEDATGNLANRQKPSELTSSEPDSPEKQPEPAGNPDQNKPNQNDSGENQPDPEESESPEENDSEYIKAISVFFYDRATRELSFLSKPLTTDESSLADAAETIVSASDTFGKLPGEHLYFYKTQTEQVVKIAVADISFVQDSAMETLCVLLLVFASSMVLFFLISSRLATFAARPLKRALTLEKQFVADTSHDLKTPISVILANVSILSRNRESSVADMMQWIDGTKDAAKNMQSLIEEMLVLSRLEATEQKRKTENVNLSEAAETMALYMESVAYEKNIAYQVAIAQNIHARTNEAYVKQIFQTLIQNALKYEPEGGNVAISLSMHHGKALFVVNNKTAQISKEDLPYIFERFYRSDKARKSNEGHGLGLAIAKHMADLIDGTIEADSSATEGTTFRLSLKADGRGEEKG